MLHDSQELRGFSVEATDGPIGQLRDYLFDDQDWAIRFFIVDTGPWLNGRKVLISPMGIGKVDWSRRHVPVALTRELVSRSPDVDTRKPVARQHEIEQYTYYGYPLPWGGPGVWRSDMGPDVRAAEQVRFVEQQQQSQLERGDDPHLRSWDGIMRYHVHANDGDIGHVDGLVIDDENWLIRYLVVNTSDWWLGHEVLVAPQWIDSIGWLDATVSVNLSRRGIQSAPRYDSDVPIDREHERRLYQHHGRPGYWLGAERDTPHT